MFVIQEKIYMCYKKYQLKSAVDGQCSWIFSNSNGSRDVERSLKRVAFELRLEGSEGPPFNLPL